MSDLSHSALLIIGHGSTENPDSATPYFDHAAAVREKGIFREVHLAFWKEEPSLREVLYQIDALEIYVVPDFISEGYFTQEVIPRELELDGATTQIHGKTIHYCPPVGIHPTMTTILSRRVEQEAPNIAREETTLFVVGHGTALNDNTTRAVKDQATLLAKRFPEFAAVHATFMEQEMFIEDWDKHCPTPNAVVVPFFIADGLHSYQDIPVLLGFEENEGLPASQKDIFRQNPYQIRGKTLYYTSAIGIEPAVGEVIIDQVHSFRKQHQIQSLPPSNTTPLAERLAEAVSQGVNQIGQIKILTEQFEAPYALCHVDDLTQLNDLTIHRDPFKAHQIATLGEDGHFRFTKGELTLKRGWLFLLENAQQLRQALDLFYPASFALWLAKKEGSLRVQNLRPKLKRQTGMYRFAHTISDVGAQQLIHDVCGPSNCCVKKILWNLDQETPLDDSPASQWPGHLLEADPAKTVPLYCQEACNHFVSKARKIAKTEADEKQAKS